MTKKSKKSDSKKTTTRDPLAELIEAREAVARATDRLTAAMAKCHRLPPFELDGGIYVVNYRNGTYFLKSMLPNNLRATAKA